MQTMKMLLAVTALMLSASLWAQTPPKPCTAIEHRAFDFLLGEWEVRGVDGKIAGSNSITAEYGGCVVHERYDTGRGYQGESLNIFDGSRGTWHQTWVDSTGLLLLLEGGMVDGKMVLAGQTAVAKSRPTRHRITWTPNRDGSVRQLWESTNSAGEWTVAFDGHFIRK